MKVTVKNVPEMEWMSESAKEVVRKFNKSSAKLYLELYCDTPCIRLIEELLEDGLYDYVYPPCEIGRQLQELIEEVAKYPRYLYFTRKDITIHYRRSYSEPFYHEKRFGDEFPHSVR